MREEKNKVSKAAISTKVSGFCLEFRPCEDAACRLNKVGYYKMGYAAQECQEFKDLVACTWYVLRVCESTALS